MKVCNNRPALTLLNLWCDIGLWTHRRTDGHTHTTNTSITITSLCEMSYVSILTSLMNVVQEVYFSFNRKYHRKYNTIS